MNWEDGRQCSGTWQGQRPSRTIHSIASPTVVNDAKPTIFLMAVLILQEVPVNKAISSIWWFILLNNISGAKGPEISQMHLVQC